MKESRFITYVLDFEESIETHAFDTETGACYFISDGCPNAETVHAIANAENVSDIEKVAEFQRVPSDFQALKNEYRLKAYRIYTSDFAEEDDYCGKYRFLY